MLHIILGILKIIGILLGIILLLLLSVFLALLFVPVRYRGKLVRNQEITRAGLRITWLSRLISVTFSFDLADGRPVLELRLFGISLARLKELLERRKNKTRRPPKKGKPQSGRESQNIPAESPKPLELPAEEDQAADEDTSFEEERPPGERETATQAHSIEAAIPEETGTQEVSADESIARDEPPRDSIPEGGFLKKLRSLPGKILELLRMLRRLWEKVKHLLLGLYQTVCGIPESLERLGEKISAGIGKLQNFSDMLEEYEAKAVLGDINQELMYLLHHYRPRKISGRLRFGTGDPASTGQLTGLIYLLLPARAEFDVEPKFTEAAFEADLEFSGRVRSVHLARVAYHLFRNKRFTRLIKRLRRHR